MFNIILKLRKYFDKKLIIILTFYYSVVVILSGIKLTYEIFRSIDTGELNVENVNWFLLFFNYLFLDWVAVILFMILISIITKRMIVRKMQWRKILFIHFFFSFIIGWVIFFSITFIELITRQLSLKTALKNFTFENFINVADLNFLIYTAMVGIIYIYYYIEELKKIEAQKSKLSIQLNNTKLNLLKSNLHPHFLFNTLNSISSLIETDTKQAQNTVADLGGLLRDFLDVKDQNLITLEQELNTLVKYINILEVRFPDHFTFISDIDDKLLQAQFPIFLLQPIIENSIKHGYSYDKTDLDVYLSIEREGEMVIITIANNGKLIPKKFLITHKNIGLTNTLERLQSLYKDNFNFFMKNKKDNSGVITHIAIPYISTIKKENV